MTLATTYALEDYQAIDSTLASWSKARNISFEKQAKGCEVRSLWIEGRIQLWVDAPDTEEFVRVHLAELKPSLLSKWGRSIEWRTTQEDLYDTLDRLWFEGQQWLS